MQPKRTEKGYTSSFLCFFTISNQFKIHPYAQNRVNNFFLLGKNTHHVCVFLFCHQALAKPANAKRKHSINIHFFQKPSTPWKSKSQSHILKTYLLPLMPPWAHTVPLLSSKRMHQQNERESFVCFLALKMMAKLVYLILLKVDQFPLSTCDFRRSSSYQEFYRAPVCNSSLLVDIIYNGVSWVPPECI